MKIPNPAIYLVTSGLLVVAGPLSWRTDAEPALTINYMNSTANLQHSRNYSDTSRSSVHTIPEINLGFPVDEDGFVGCGVPDILPNLDENVYEQEAEQVKPNIDKCSSDGDVQDERGHSSPLCMHLDVVNIPRNTLSGFYVPDNSTTADRKTKLLISLADT